MPLTMEIEGLSDWVKRFPTVGMNTLGGAGAPMSVLDFVMIGAVKRSLSLASGVLAMIQARNMVCSRALLRMQLDTVSRLLAYTYVTDSERVAKAVIGGRQLSTFRTVDGQRLTDSYLIKRFSQQHPWVEEVYKFTSGYIHFSERQFFDSVHSMSDDEQRILTLQISHIDNKFPEESWSEIAACFNHLSQILVGILYSYQANKSAKFAVHAAPDETPRT